MPIQRCIFSEEGSREHGSKRMGIFRTEAYQSLLGVHLGCLFSVKDRKPSRMFSPFCSAANSRSRVISTARSTAAVSHPCLRPARVQMMESGLFSAIRDA